MNAQRVDTALHGKLVLLIDDESVIREIGGEMLESLGMTCITAKDGEEAVTLYKKHRDDIALVVLDIELPGICGNEIHVTLKEFNPGVRVLFTSGYTQEYVENRYFKHKLTHFMPKPFQINKLSGYIKRLMQN